MAGRIVILGAGGLLGQVLTRRARSRGQQVLALSSGQCDITDPAAVRGHLVPGLVVINCAAYTKVDDAETDAARAFLVNATGAGNIARSCAEIGVQLVHVSTDYVFSGDRRAPYDTDEPTGPVNVYGRSKLAGEAEVLAALPTARVVRTSWVYGGAVDGTDFVSVMRRKAAGPDEVQVADDQVGSPTYVADLADALVDIADGAGTAAVLHAANGGAASRFEQAQAVFELLGADPQRVRPVSSERFPRPAPRPAYTALAARRS
ncbi:MAG: dTDP-4-dehydrorhamnose reductase, partial [Mycobacterium sp.]|nr:dTDP-4-dehydrorhamnose reductase [Mycobacterium sp.]